MKQSTIKHLYFQDNQNYNTILERGFVITNPIYIGTRTEWSPIRSVNIRVIDEIKINQKLWQFLRKTLNIGYAFS